MKNLPTRQVLDELLESSNRFALVGRGTGNHCPMALAALACMGAGPERLRQFFERWEREFSIPAPPLGPVPARADWRNFMAGASGREDEFEALHRCFQEWMTQDGIDAVLRQVIDEVPFEPAAGAFHALIRLGHGLELDHVGEVAAGLAQLLSNNLPITAPPADRPPFQTAAEGLAHISAALGGRKFTGTWIQDRLHAADADPQFAAALAQVPATEEVLDELSDLAIAAYWQTNNFTILHIVTGMRAARLLFERLPSDPVPRLLPPLWLAACAAYATVGSPALQSFEKMEAEWTGPAPSPEGWAAVLAAAVESDDDHVIKVSHACHQESLRNPTPLYFAAASRAVGRMA